MSKVCFVYFALLVGLVTCAPEGERLVVSREVMAVPPKSSFTPSPQPATPTLTAVPPTPTTTATITAIPTHTATPTSTPTSTPWFDVTPQAAHADSVSVEIYPDENFTQLMIRITQDDVPDMESNFEQFVFSGSSEIVPTYSAKITAVQDQDQDGFAEIILEVTGRGMRCCDYVVVLYRTQDVKQYRPTNYIERERRPQVIDLDGDGKLEFVTLNTPYNALMGGMGVDPLSPLQVFRYDNEAIVDVTNQYPELVEEDANFWLSTVRRETLEVSDIYFQLTYHESEFWLGDIGGVERWALYAYLADMIMLDKGEEGCQIVQEYYQEENLCPGLLEQAEEALEEARAWDERREIPSAWQE